MWSPKSCLFSLLTIVLLGCSREQPRLRASRYVPPPIYTEWWETMEKCSGVVPPVAMTKVNFYIVPAPYFIINADTVVGVSGKDVTGQRYIYVVPSVLLDERTIEHEMLHTILNNRPGHPYWPGTWPCRVWTPEGYVLHGGER